MSTIINGTSDAITFPDSTVQNTSAIVGGKVPFTNLPAGSVLQVVQGFYNSSVSTNSTSYVTTNLTASITPKFSTSKILVLVSGQIYSSGAATGVPVAIYRGGSNLFEQSFGYNSAGTSSCSCNINYLDSPATTSSTTYTAYFKTGSGAVTAYFNSGTYNTSIQLLEIAG